MRSSLFFFLATFFLIVADADNSQAQLFASRRTHLSRAASTASFRSHSVSSSARTRAPQGAAARPVFPIEDYFTPRRPAIARILDGPMTYQYRNPAEVDSRYIGGFHQSHFQNLGIPSGDIGIRGNAYNWNTW